MVVALTAVNVVIVLVAGYGALHSMESPVVLRPGVPHADAPAVHGVAGRPALAGRLRAMPHRRRGPRLRQVQDERRAAAVSRRHGALSRDRSPASPTCVPRMEVCGTCHWSGKGFGDVVRVKREYADDETNTETVDDPADVRGRPGRADAQRPRHPLARRSTRAHRIHLHRRANARPFRSSSTRMRRAASASTPLRAQRPEQLAKGTWRTMDCVDCHNVVAHRVAPTPEQAVDAALAAGRIDRGLPFVRREAVRLMKASHATSDEAARVIDEESAKVLHVTRPRRRRPGRPVR